MDCLEIVRVYGFAIEFFDLLSYRLSTILQHVGVKHKSCEV